MTVQKKSSNTLKNQIYSQLFDQIICGEYRPNDILSEKLLVEKFQVSKSPVREALIELCNEGVLRSIPRCGYEVLGVTQKEVDEIREYRIILECGYLETYWDKFTTEKIDYLQRIVDSGDHSDEPCKALEHWKNNTQFHIALVECYGSSFLIRNLESCLRVLYRVYAQFFWDTLHQTEFPSEAVPHKMFLQALREGDKQRAIAYLKEDISNFHH